MMTENKKSRRVLLIEPNYKNKYPPLGLMKLASYHKMRGDHVRFYKGDIRDFIVDLYADEAISIFSKIDSGINWNNNKKDIGIYIRYGRKASFEYLIKLTCFGPLLGSWLSYFSKAYRSKKIIDSIRWDRICISTLFTFYYSITIDTINYSKNLLKEGGEILIGGVMATVIPKEIETATGIKPICGLLDKPGILDIGDSLVIDELPPDYSILEEIEYKYPENDAYYGYTSRGCIRKCKFCAVPILEPKYNNFISLSDKIKKVEEKFGGRKNLLLLDNNVLASDKFNLIIEEIKLSGFFNGATFVEPNRLEIAINSLKSGDNILGYRKSAFDILKKLRKKLTGQARIQLESVLSEANFSEEYLPTKEQFLNIYDKIADMYESKRNKNPKKRYVDFNQGIDARLITEEKMELLSSIPIRPLRIAFDSVKDADIYEKAIRLAKKYNINHLSNYILFNFQDEPVELYQRLRLNVLLSEELDLHIYSFPMRYSPIFDDNDSHHNRNFIGEKWNKKFIRAVQCILNATKGKVGRKREFFEASFGINENKFFEILWMPESYILYREMYEKNGYTQSWRDIFYSLSADELNQAQKIILHKRIDRENIYRSEKLNSMLKHYGICEIII